MLANDGCGGSGSRELYSVRADILGELRGRDDEVVVTEPFWEGTDVWEDISAGIGGARRT
jgi:hypothetical protein